MKKWQIGLVLGIIFVNANIHAQSIYETNACDDSLYLKLKEKNINEMTAREYEYFIMKEKECANNRTISNSNQSKQILPTKTCEESREAGKQFAETNKFGVGGGWYAMGVGAGFLGGFIGGGFVITLASVSKPTPDTIKVIYDAKCFKEGYKKVVKRKRVLGVVTGALTGFAILLAVLISTSN